MKIVLTGDTHLPGKGSKLPNRLVTACKHADLIIHTGDFKSPDVLHTLESFAEVRAVYGNIDGEDIRRLLPAKHFFDIGKLRAGLIHGDGDKKTTERRALDAFEGEQLDILIYGHSHIPVIKYFKNILLLNPGSPTDKRKLPFYSFIELTIDEGIKPELILFEDKS